MRPYPLSFAAQRHVDKIFIRPEGVERASYMFEIIVPPQRKLLTGTHAACLQSNEARITH